jgi:phage repressor protein C with HTH and peptisase S24 domain
MPDLGATRRKDLPRHHFIPVINSSSIKTYDLDFYKNKEIIEFYYSLPDFYDCAFVITMHGRFMEPLISDGEQLVLQLMKNKKIMSWGEVYLIITDEQVFVRHIDQSPRPNHWLLRAHNTAYGVTEIHEKDAKAYFKVKGSGMKRYSI